jgi:hypothetical protein
MPAASEGTYPYAVLCAGLYATQPVDPMAMTALFLVKCLFLQGTDDAGNGENSMWRKSSVYCCGKQ